MIIVAGTYRIDADSREAFAERAAGMLAETRKEDGCLVYSFAFDVEETGLVRIYEEWQSRAHLDAHFKTPHMADWRALLTDLGAERAVKVFESEGGEAI